MKLGSNFHKPDTSRIQTYGLDALLTGEDDPALWEAAL